MSGLPLRAIDISDFRRLAGHRTLPLDAPVVLLHGPNGAGKTSVLSALELALTGEVRSMRRLDDRYTAHIPTHSHAFATVRAEVADEWRVGQPQRNMTVGGDRIEGEPALSADAAQFYSERCYLDQVSLGRLLEIYQAREDRGESALARFVNELLGLDQLDSLRTGLSDALDVRRLRKLSDAFADAEASAERANAQLRQVTLDLEAARAELAQARQTLLRSLADLGQQPPEAESPDFETVIERLLQGSQLPEEGGGVRQLNSRLTALGGRIQGLISRPSIVHLEDAKFQAAEVAEAQQQWSVTFQTPIARWRDAVAALDIDGLADAASALEEELSRLESSLARNGALAAERDRAEERISGHEATLDALQAEISAAEQQAGSLASALASLREHVSDNICPVCDRDFSELGGGHLSAHLDRKIAQLTDLGQRLQELTRQRDSIQFEMEGDKRALTAIHVQLLLPDQLTATAARRDAVEVLRDRLEEFLPAIVEGDRLAARNRAIQSELAELHAAELEEHAVRTELDSAAAELGVPRLAPPESLSDAWRRLADVASARAAAFETRSAALTAATESFSLFRTRRQRADQLRAGLAEAAEEKLTWDRRVGEVKRRQAVAREVHSAANDARSAIVQQVFTQSLNEVWRSVFTRLAPREPFVPMFGIPSSTKTALELRLQTVHSSGDRGGPPQMMLSAGNLNTAALSLFIALHLAVEPVVPCLVFDDPVQSMDEVHVAQFAGLIRILSKNHDRQVIVAVHERELFEYLTLELSPAYPGDSLITIELGDRADEADGGVRRLRWSPDPALAG